MAALAKTQVGFGHFLVLPCFQKIASHVPLFSELAEQLSLNIAQWKLLQEDGK